MGRAANRKWAKRTRIVARLIRKGNASEVLDYLRNIRKLHPRFWYDWPKLRELMRRSD